MEAGHDLRSLVRESLDREASKEEVISHTYVDCMSWEAVVEEGK